MCTHMEVYNNQSYIYHSSQHSPLQCSTSLLQATKFSELVKTLTNQNVWLISDFREETLK